MASKQQATKSAGKKLQRKLARAEAARKKAATTVEKLRVRLDRATAKLAARTGRVDALTPGSQSPAPPDGAAPRTADPVAAAGTGKSAKAKHAPHPRAHHSGVPVQ